MDSFQRAFEIVVGHEGGYVNDPRAVIEYVNECETENRSRIRSEDAGGAGICGPRPKPRGSIHLRFASQLAQVQLSSAGVRAPSVRQGLVQCALHPRPQGTANGGSGSSEEARGRLRVVWRANRCKGWMGLMPAPLQAGPLRDVEGCGNRSFRRQVRPLRRVVSPSGVRLPSSRGQAWLSKRDVPKQVAQRLGSRAGQVHLAVRQLPPTGAPR